jgi:DNA mismatch repair protein MutL
MPKIRILPEQLANRIAAGEVVERPASVVKELIENSLDAGANRIEVEIEGGGTRLIRIIDDGEGMDEDDILLCFERHGTSKITDSHDLVAISTLGFRGEAIPSIASVAKMAVTSRPRSNDFGTKVEFEYGRLHKVHEVGCGHGTIIEIRNLFGKTPARRKFLRTVRTELGHIDEVLKNYALACPEVTFTLTVNDKKTLHFDSSSNLEKRLNNIIHYSGGFIAVGKDNKNAAKRQIQGFLVPPEHTLSGSARLRLFINGRAVKDRLMSHSIGEGLRGFLLKGHSPAGYIHLRLPSEEIDVNVHPAKLEIRFRNGRDIHQFIKQSVEAAMLEYQQTIRTDLFGKVEPQTESHSIEHPVEDIQPTLRTHIRSSANSQEVSPQQEQTNIWQNHTADEQDANHTADLDLQQFESREPVVASQPQSQNTAPEAQSSHEETKNHNLRIVGQFKDLYIFCQSGDNLIVIDQHAAHERLLFEKFRKQYTGGKVTGQTLLFPEPMELSPFQMQLVENNIEELEKMGFSISEFGGNSFILSAIPAIAGQCNGSELFLDILESFGKEGDKRSKGGRLDDVLATMACKAAVKSGDELSPREIHALLEQMARADLFSHCPHGRPVLKNFTSDEIKKWFHRT